MNSSPTLLDTPFVDFTLDGRSPPVTDLPPLTLVAEPVLLNDQSLFRRWLSDMPSWLTSFVIHLLCFLTIMSLRAPVCSRTGGQSLVLTMILGRDTSGSTSELPDVLVPTSLPVKTKSDDRSNQSEDSASEDTAAKLQGNQRTADRSEVQSMSLEPSTGLESTSPTDSPTYKYAALTNRAQAKRAARASQLLAQATLQHDSEHDEIVERFIQFDIGKLRGRAGAQALRDFQALGPEALPALTKGLNLSASIHASCPVGVIASKLIAALRAANNPSLTQYAIDHIGEGVPRDAPHYQKLVVLRDQWLGNGSKFHGRELTEMLVSRGLQGEGETFELAMSLADSPSDNLLVALESSDEDLCVPALVALIQRCTKLTLREKTRASRVLASKDLTTASNELRRLVSEATAMLDRELAPWRKGNAAAHARTGALIPTSNDPALRTPPPTRVEDGMRFDRWNSANQPWNRGRPGIGE
jgi:hypothetical protein